jgi:GH25 family lysozyme M1 (1,4-beta-N-acetylmuramidase)
VIFGLDVSGYQKDADFKKARDGRDGYECSFLAVKLTQGNLGANFYALAQTRAALAAGIVDFCWYHFVEPNGPDWAADARAEAESVIAAAQRVEENAGIAKPGTIFVDVEPLPSKPLPTAAEIPLWRLWLNEFRKTVEAAGRKLGVYGSPSFLHSIGLDDSWADLPLWLAAYPATFVLEPATFPHPPAPFKEVLLWQHGGGMRKPYGNEATWPGIASYADVNVFNGTKGGFRLYVSDTAPDDAPA